MSDAMQTIQFFNKYSRYDWDKGRRESWSETVERAVDYLVKFGGEEVRQLLFDPILNKEVSPSMRLFATAGVAADKNQVSIYNCSYLPLQGPGDFSDLTLLLGHGVGVGFSVENVFVKKWPIVPLFSGTTVNFVVDDSIEGWALSFSTLISFMLSGIQVVFDYNRIRPAGAPLKTRGGHASGPAPLKEAHEAIVKIFNERQGQYLLSVDVFDIACHVAQCIVSGGVRRCLPSGSLVHMKGGMVPIENVRVGDEVLTSKGFYPVSNKFEQGKQALVRVVTQDSSFECTPNHMIAVMDGDDSYIWKHASELVFGDKLIAPSFGLDGDKQTLPEFYYEKPKNSTTCKDIVIPELDTKLAWLLGLLHGDGYVGTKDVTIPVHKDQFELGTEAARQLGRFGVNVRVSEEDNYFVLRATSKQLATYFRSWLKQPHTSIVIPDFIWAATSDIKLAYVAGVMDADGSIRTRPIQIVSTVYEDFAKQIRLLLSSCGVQARVKKLSEAGLKERWQPKFEVSLINSVSKTIVSEIPELFKHRMAISKNSEQCTNKMPSGVVWSKTYSPLIPVSFIRLETVDGEEDTWDLEVDTAHEFFCEGYLVHNSAMIAIFDWDDVEMKAAKSGEWWRDNLQRQNANISAVVDRKMGLEEWDEYIHLMDSNKSGEPGIWSRYAIRKSLPERRQYVEFMGPNPLTLAA